MRGLIAAAFISIAMVSGCATAYKMNQISIGMMKQQVVEILGPPVSISAKSGVEYLNYRFSETDAQARAYVTTPYFVRLVNGKVESYGRLGDFDSTKPLETKSTVDLNVKKQ